MYSTNKYNHYNIQTQPHTTTTIYSTTTHTTTIYSTTTQYTVQLHTPQQYIVQLHTTQRYTVLHTTTMMILYSNYNHAVFYCSQVSAIHLVLIFPDGYATLLLGDVNITMYVRSVNRAAHLC